MTPEANEKLKQVRVVKVTSAIDSLVYRPEMPFIWRGMALGMARDLAFSIIALCSQEVRARRTREMETIVAKEQAEIAAGIPPGELSSDDYVPTSQLQREREEEEQRRFEQGFALQMPPLILAAKLKVVRDWLAYELDMRAGTRVNYNDPHMSRMKDPFHLAQPLVMELDRQLKRNTTVTAADAEEEALLLGVSAETIAKIKSRQRNGGVKFLHDNRGEILSLIDGLVAVKPRPQGSENDVDYQPEFYTIAEAEQVELTLPAIHRARMFVSADRGLKWESENQVAQMLKRVPEAKGNYYAIIAQRVNLHAKFDRFTTNGDIKQEIAEAVSLGAAYPVMEVLTAEEVALYEKNLQAAHKLADLKKNAA